jgi:hypothetical protein
MRYVDGLKDYIRTAVALHHPQHLDTACALAKLQEEVAAPAQMRELRRWENSVGARPYAARALPLPPPPPRLALPAPAAKPVAEAGRGPSSDDHWAALRASRRAQGLCMRCGGKWSRDHQCPAAVQLHVVQELLDMIRDHQCPAAVH